MQKPLPFSAFRVQANVVYYSTTLIYFQGLSKILQGLSPVGLTFKAALSFSLLIRRYEYKTFWSAIKSDCRR